MHEKAERTLEISIDDNTSQLNTSLDSLHSDYCHHKFISALILGHPTYAFYKMHSACMLDISNVSMKCILLIKIGSFSAHTICQCLE